MNAAKIIINGETVELGGGGSVPQDLKAEDIGFEPGDTGLNSDNVQGAIEELSELRGQGVYSTDEIRIGTWTDGKPFYRKIITTTTPDTENSTTPVFTFKNQLDFCIISGFFLDGQGNSIPINTFNPNNNLAVFTCYFKASNSINIRTNTSVWSNRPCQIIVEYTKTTDKATIAIPAYVLFPKETLEEMANTHGLDFTTAATASDIV